MPSKQPARPVLDEAKNLTREQKVEPIASDPSQAFLRDQLPAPQEPTSYLLGSTLQGTGDLSSSRAASYQVGDRTISSALGVNTLQKSSQISGGDLGSGRGDEFLVAGRTVSSKIGANTLQKSSQISGGDLGSGRGDEFLVAGRTVSSKIGANTLQQSSKISGGDLGSGRDGTEMALANPDLVLEPSLQSQIPGLAPANGENVSVSLPLAPQVAAAQIAAGETPSQELLQEAGNALEKATLIHPEDIPAGLLEALPANTILRFAFSPEDMGALDLQAEHEAVAKVADVLTLNNPTEETMKYVLSTGQFEDVIWSGHGATEGLWITDLDGKAKMLPAAEVANLLEGTGVQEVLLNVCNGGGDVDNALAAAGINSFAYDRTIIDAEAVADATNFATSGSLWGIDTRSRLERRLDDGAGQVMTARRLEKEQKAERFDQLTSQMGSWVSDKDQRKEQKESKHHGLENAAAGLMNAFSGMGGKGLVKKLGDLLKGKGQSKSKKSNKSNKPKGRKRS